MIARGKMMSSEVLVLSSTCKDLYTQKFEKRLELLLAGAHQTNRKVFNINFCCISVCSTNGLQAQHAELCKLQYVRSSPYTVHVCNSSTKVVLLLLLLLLKF